MLGGGGGNEKVGGWVADGRYLNAGDYFQGESRRTKICYEER
jgi:hypothetical protein